MAANSMGTVGPTTTETQYRSPIWVLVGFGSLLVGLILYGVLSH
jgi:hypothetical protein